MSSFQSLDFYSEVLDIQWHPNISYVFASVAKDGRLELWDLDNNQMDASIQLKPSDEVSTFLNAVTNIS